MEQQRAKMLERHERMMQEHRERIEQLRQRNFQIPRPIAPSPIREMPELPALEIKTGIGV